MGDRPHNLTSTDLGLNYFTEPEFRGWWPLMDPRLLVLLDVIRERAGLIIDISPVDRAIGRRDGDDNYSDHNVSKWGRVYGVDVMPRWKYSKGFKLSIGRQAINFAGMATDTGFTSIGYYPDWHSAKAKISPGFHLGTRRSRRAGAPATWGRVNKPGGGYIDMSMMAALGMTDTRMS